MLVAAMFSTSAVKAQEDVNPLLKYISKDESFKASIGGRMYADLAYYHSDWTPMKSGAAITDARIHAALEYGKFYIYADFGFGKGEFSQKNLFVQYNFKESLKGIHSVKVGYYNEPSSMSAMTSTYNYHFFARPAAVQALAPGRALGATYRFFNDKFFFDQGIFAQLKYNDQDAGYQGLSLSGRWLYKPVNDEHHTFQFGFSARYQRFNAGTVYQDGVFETNVNYSANMQSYVDEDVQRTLSPSRRNSCSVLTVSLPVPSISGPAFGRTVTTNAFLRASWAVSRAGRPCRAGKAATSSVLRSSTVVTLNWATSFAARHTPMTSNTVS